MKAIIYTEYGPPEVLQLKELETPAPTDNEVRVKNYATTVNFGDLIARKFDQVSASEFSMPGILWLPARMDFGFSKPRKGILGNEFAGEIESVGKDVKRFKAGDQVFGYCGQSMGAYAEYLCISEDGMLAEKPANMSYAEAAALPYGAIMALSLLRAADLQRGQKILINGASGGIGSQAVQLAKAHFGAEVTGVCGAPRLEFVKSLGADQVIDYTQEDFTQNGETYDLIIDIMNKSSFSDCKNSLKENGRYLLTSFKTKQLLQMLRTKISGDKKVICVLLPEKVENLVLIKELVEAGKIKSIIDRSFPLEQAAEAHRYVETGQKKGHVVITMEHDHKI